MKLKTVLLFAAAGLAGTIAWISTSPRAISLPDGTLVRLTRMKFDDDNIFLHGSALEKALGNFLPTNGLGLGRFRLHRPTQSNPYVFEQPTLSLEFQLSGPPIEARVSGVISPKFNREFRLVLLGDDGFPYVEEFPQRIARYRDGVFLYVNATAYPRRSRTLRFLLQQHDDPMAPWRTVAEFRRRNPVEESEEWAAETMPVRRMSGPFEFIAGPVTVEANHSNQWQSFWATTVTIPFQLREDGVLRTNWNLHHVFLADASGNFIRFLAHNATMEKGSKVFRTFRSLDPRTVWRIRAGVAAVSDFGPSNLFTLKILRSAAGSMTTNIAGHDFYARWTSDRTMTVELSHKPPDLRLALSRAWDEGGQDVGNQIVSAGQFEIWKRFPTPSEPSSSSSEPVTLEVAVTRNLPVEFTIQPQLMESKDSSWLDAMKPSPTNSP
ncbi:MAG TPA: hypothetical protein VJS65_03105 [Verrucomicrobiae bacterium]|nr:hypothetical protein [Verrucomicrobiae bacterium]